VNDYVREMALPSYRFCMEDDGGKRKVNVEGENANSGRPWQRNAGAGLDLGRAESKKLK
jgi:hypothetical protein